MKAERGLFLELVERNFLPLPGSVIFDIAGRDLVAVALCQVMTQSNKCHLGFGKIEAPRLIDAQQLLINSKAVIAQSAFKRTMKAR